MSRRRKQNWLAWGAPVILAPSPFTTALLAAKAVKELARPPKVDSDDAKNVKKIIKAGRECGVEDMTVKIRKEIAVGLDIAHKEVRATLGTHGKTEYELRVKYNNHETTKT